MISCCARVKSLNNRRYITEDTGIHESFNIAKSKSFFFLGLYFIKFVSYSYSHPTNITQMVKIFSASVFGATLPNPTDVNDVNVK